MNHRKVGAVRLLRAAEAAEYLAISVRTFWALVAAGQIPRVEVSRGSVRFMQSDLDAYIEDARKEIP